MKYDFGDLGLDQKPIKNAGVDLVESPRRLHGGVDPNATKMSCTRNTIYNKNKVDFYSLKLTISYFRNNETLKESKTL